MVTTLAAVGHAPAPEPEPTEPDVVADDEPTEAEAPVERATVPDEPAERAVVPPRKRKR